MRRKDVKSRKRRERKQNSSKMKKRHASSELSLQMETTKNSVVSSEEKTITFDSKLFKIIPC